MSTLAPAAWDCEMMSATGLATPRTFEVWTTQTSREPGKEASKISMSRTSRSVSIGTTRISMPFSSANNCQGTISAWCSISVITTASPGLRLERAQPHATRLIASVVPLVKIRLSRVVPNQSASVSRAASYCSVASAAKVCTAR